MSDDTVGIKQDEGADRQIDNEVHTNDQAQTVFRQKVATVHSDDLLFARLLKFEPHVGEEIRRDETLTDDYHGLAPDGTLESASAWAVVRFYKTAGLITRARLRTGIRWDQRSSGW